MLGDIGAAEDVVQDAFSRLIRADLGEIEDERGWPAASGPSRTIKVSCTTRQNMCPLSMNARPPNICRSVTASAGGSTTLTRSARSSS
jgi:hypothetical protein